MVAIGVQKQNNDRVSVLLSRFFFNSFMAHLTKVRTALVALTANDRVREAHSYEYDNNGNIVYVNTSRLKPDMTAQPDTVQRTRDKRTVPLALERKGARRASEAQLSEKTLTVTLSRITNAYTQSCWIANPAELESGRGWYDNRHGGAKLADTLPQTP